jgi:hypothetical protein
MQIALRARRELRVLRARRAPSAAAMSRSQSVTV